MSEYDLSPNDGRTEELIRRYERSVKENRTEYFDVDEIDALVEYYVTHGVYSLSKRVVELGLRLHPASTAMKFTLAKAQFSYGHFREALRIMNALMEMEIDADYFLLRAETLVKLHRVNEAMREFEKAVEEEKSQKGLMCIDVATFLSGEDMLDEAELFVKRAYALEPKNIDVLENAAYILRDIELPEAAVEMFNNLLDIDPYSPCWMDLGMTLFSLERFDDSARAFEFTCAIEPENYEAWMYKGHSYFYAEHYRKAVESYEFLLGKDADQDEVLLRLGECYERLGDYKSAEKYYRRAYAGNPQNLEACTGVAVSLIEQEKFSDALSVLHQMVYRFEDTAETWVYIAECYMGLDKRDETLRSYEMALRRRPVFPEVLLSMGVIFFSEGDADKALGYFCEAEYLDSQLAPLHPLLGLCYFVKGEYDKTEYYFKKAAGQSLEQLNSLFDGYGGLSKVYNVDFRKLIKYKK